MLGVLRSDLLRREAAVALPQTRGYKQHVAFVVEWPVLCPPPPPFPPPLNLPSSGSGRAHDCQNRVGVVRNSASLLVLKPGGF